MLFAHLAFVAWHTVCYFVPDNGLHLRRRLFVGARARLGSALQRRSWSGYKTVIIQRECTLKARLLIVHGTASIEYPYFVAQFAYGCLPVHLLI
jgi:hypothetical protein